jgi:Tol biopolymer transport system component
VNPAWSPDGTKIAFATNRDGNYEIYTMNPDGTGPTRLTNNTSSDYEPAWSPDGTKIAFATNRDGNDEIYTMNADASNQTRLTNNTAVDAAPAWSPDGTKIAFKSTGDTDPFAYRYEIYTMNADGSSQTNLTNNPGADDSVPDWQPVTAAPTPCTVRITNGGWIVTDDGDRASFGGVANETSTGADSGSEHYQDQGPAEPMSVHSLQITNVTCDQTGTNGSIFGTATIDGTGSHAFQIDVTDNGSPGKGTDHYRIRIPDVGYDSGDHLLRAGNVQIH